MRRALLLFLTLAGCWHSYRIEGYDEARPAGLNGLRDKRVVVVFAEPAVRSEYKGSSHLHCYTWTGARDFYEEGFRRLLRGTVKSLTFRDGESGGAGDLFLHPELAITLDSTLSRSIVRVRFGLRVVDAEGRELGAAFADAAEEFSVIARADEIRERGMASTFEKVAAHVLVGIE